MAKTKIDPKNLVKVGRLKQVTDSLTSSANYKDSALKQMIPESPNFIKKSDQLQKSGIKDLDSSMKYNKMINKAEGTAIKKMKNLSNGKSFKN
jgi:hypothetical protein